MAKTKDLWPLLAVGGLGLWWWTRRSEGTAEAGNGLADYNGVTRREPPYGADIGGPATPSGSILSLRSGGVELSSHRAIKRSGATADVIVTWQNTTIDGYGNPIAWPARLIVELGHSTGTLGPISLGGWDNMADLLSDPGAGRATVTYDLPLAGPGSHTDSVRLRIGREPNPPQDWDVRVTLQMDESDIHGSPEFGTWFNVEVATHENAVTTPVEALRAGPWGSIGSIIVGQGDTQMRKLGLSQSRPPWGVAIGEARNWPISNRNPMLPGVKIRVRQKGGGERLGSPIGPGYRVYAV